MEESGVTPNPTARSASARDGPEPTSTARTVLLLPTPLSLESGPWEHEGNAAQSRCGGCTRRDRGQTAALAPASSSPTLVPTSSSLRCHKTTSSQLEALQRAYAVVQSDDSPTPLPDLLEVAPHRGESEQADESDVDGEEVTNGGSIHYSISYCFRFVVLLGSAVIERSD